MSSPLTFNYTLRQQLRYPLGLRDSFPPDTFLHRTKNQIRIANHGGIRPTKELREQMLDFVFLTNQQVTRTAETARIVEGNLARRVKFGAALHEYCQRFEVVWTF